MVLLLVELPVPDDELDEELEPELEPEPEPESEDDEEELDDFAGELLDEEPRLSFR
ncbi:hypothetical protein GCM10010303_57850 [Streptomyces purpurascens]|nr:hypothetical protein GCM10010303_57850 [Streptomyces purpurascens]